MRAYILKSSFAFALTWVLFASVMPNHLLSITLEKNKLYFVGVGPAGPEMATLQAIEAIKQAEMAVRDALKK